MTMGTILDLNPRLQAARRAEVDRFIAVPMMAAWGFASVWLVLLPFAMMHHALGEIEEDYWRVPR